MCVAARTAAAGNASSATSAMRTRRTGFGMSVYPLLRFPGEQSTVAPIASGSCKEGYEACKHAGEGATPSPGVSRSLPRLTPRRPSAPSDCELREQRVHALEARPRACLDAVLHRRVSLLHRLEAHRLRELRPLAELLELERLQVVLERLHETSGRIHLAEL